MITRYEVNTNNGMKWRRFIVPKKIEQINDQHLFIDISDVCLEAEASPRCSLEAEDLLPRPRLDVLMPRLGLASPRDYCLGASHRSRLFCLGCLTFMNTHL